MILTKQYVGNYTLTAKQRSSHYFALLKEHANHSCDNALRLILVALVIS